jgi:hypothetical protein
MVQLIQTQEKEREEKLRKLREQEELAKQRERERKKLHNEYKLGVGPSEVQHFAAS